MPALTSTLGELGTFASAFWRWWSGELRAFVPTSRRRHARAKRVMIKPTADSVTLEVIDDEVGKTFVDPRPLDQLDEEAWAELADLLGTARAQILMEPPSSYVAHARLPRAAMKRLRSAAEIQLASLAPLAIEHLAWTTSVSRVDAQMVELAIPMLRAVDVAKVDSLFAANGLSTPPIGVLVADDFVEVVAGDDASRTVNAADRRAWLAAAALVASIPFSIAAGANFLAANAEGRAAALQREIAPKLGLEKRARSLQARRDALRPVVARPSASTTIEQLASRLPMTDYLRSAEQSEAGLSFQVATRDPEALAETATAELGSVKLADLVPGEGEMMLATYQAEPGQ